MVSFSALYASSHASLDSLEDFLDEIFASSAKKTFVANDTEKEKFANFIKLYEKGLFIAQKVGVTI